MTASASAAAVLQLRFNTPRFVCVPVLPPPTDGDGVNTVSNDTECALGHGGTAGESLPGTLVGPVACPTAMAVTAEAVTAHGSAATGDDGQDGAATTTTTSPPLCPADSAATTDAGADADVDTQSTDVIASVAMPHEPLALVGVVVVVAPSVAGTTESRTTSIASIAGTAVAAATPASGAATSPTWLSTTTTAVVDAGAGASSVVSLLVASTKTAATAVVSALEHSSRTPCVESSATPPLGPANVADGPSGLLPHRQSSSFAC